MCVGIFKQYPSSILEGKNEHSVTSLWCDITALEIIVKFGITISLEMYRSDTNYWPKMLD